MDEPKPADTKGLPPKGLPDVTLRHVGLYVTDIDAIVDFYSDVLGFIVSDRGPFQGEEIAFLTRDPEEHHEIVVMSGRPAGSFGTINQISFRAETLADLQDESPRPLLLQVVADPAMAKAVRLYAAWILGRLDDPSGIRYIGGLLQDADPYVRLRTAWTLGEIGHLEASFVLRSALRDVDRAVRIHAAWALNRLLRQPSRARG